MGKFADFLNKLQLGRRILTVALVGVVLLVTTACNSGDRLGARPNNPPVQMGGQNNPHKAGGDTYSQYKMTTDPTVKGVGDQSSVIQNFNGLIATNRVDNTPDILLYPGLGDIKSAISKDDFVGPEQRSKLMDPNQIPAER